MRLLACARSRFRLFLIATGLSLALPLPAHASGPPATAKIQSAIEKRSTGELRAFYVQRDRPLWVAGDGSLDPAAGALLRLIETAEYDGLSAEAFGAGALAEAIRRAEAKRSPKTLARAELALSGALAAYAGAVAEPADPGAMVYEHAQLRPVTPGAEGILRAAAAAPSLEDFVAGMRWMHPLYAELRQRLMAGDYEPPVRRAAIASLQRIRAIPAAPWQRHLVIDAASARLWMYEGGRAVDSMRVVAGKPETPTPLMAGYVRDAVLNPYWNVPEDLVRRTIAAGVLSQGTAYLRARRYDVLADWSDQARKLNPARVDWRAVSSGALEVRVRQAPGGANAMGRVKYEFPNPLGIYLHDTPDKDLMLADDRHFSNGCIRLEDAERLGRWLLGGDLPPAGRNPEQRVSLAQPVPIYITYLTVQTEGDRLALTSDPYGRDGALALARLD